MCANYESIHDEGILATFFGAKVLKSFEGKTEIFPLGKAPFIRLDESGRRAVEIGQFGLLPFFAKEVAYGRNTYNARTETVKTKPSYRDAWKKSQRCIVPAKHIFEQYYEPTMPHEPTSKPVRWKIWRADLQPMAIAGIYNIWKDEQGADFHTFSMLTVNADGHPVMSQFHAPGDEKRMVVMLDQDQQDAWLTCSPDEAAGFFKRWDGELVAAPAPSAPRKKKEPAAKPQAEPPADLFG